LEEAVLPVSQKRAIVRPALKKSGLDPDLPSSYRPISNLTYLSKLIERVVAFQLVNYLEANGLMPKNQSGFRRGHSTETLLLRLMSDLHGAMDRGQVTLLALLDVSAAFDTVDHHILLTRLSTTYGITGQALAWMSSYLDGRTMRVEMGEDGSQWTLVEYGVPQGSVLGPLLYILYTADLATILSSSGLQSHQFADDLQMYQSCRPGDSSTCVAAIYTALQEVRRWMSSNRLRLNPSKTQYIWFGSPASRQKINPNDLVSSFPVGEVCTVVRDLGVLLDEGLTLSDHVNNICRIGYYELRQIRVIRRTLSRDAAATLVHSFVLSRLDYCNGVLLGLPGYRLKQLQLVINSAARLLADLPRFAPISDYIRRELHWLPVVNRINYKVATLVWKAMTEVAPDYITELCLPVSSQPGRRMLRSAAKNDLIIPRSRTVMCTQRGLFVAAPLLWNSLPLPVRNTINTKDFVSFIRLLKTHLFSV
jgi:hypothetical protein